MYRTIWSRFSFAFSKNTLSRTVRQHCGVWCIRCDTGSGAAVESIILRQKSLISRSVNMDPEATLITILEKNGGQMLYGKLTREMKNFNHSFDLNTANSTIMQLRRTKKIDISNGIIILAQTPAKGSS